MDKKLHAEFKDPPVEYKGKPFWSWNGELDKDELLRQTGILKEMGFGGHFMHSRAGLITEYLGDEWFDLINAVADESEKLGLEAWLYDEDRYPSGSAGGKATADPQYRAKSIVNRETLPEHFQWADYVYIAFVAKIDGNILHTYKRIFKEDDIRSVIASKEEKVTEKSGAWKILYYTVGSYPDHPNFNNGSPLDVISREAVRKFIDETHEKYKEKCGDRLGRSIKGIFTDEPRRFDAIHFDLSSPIERFAATVWTTDLDEIFKERYGYSLIEHIPELFYWPKGRKVAPVKLDYFNLTTDLFCENYAGQIQAWCLENNVILTGHGLEEANLREQLICIGSLMRLYEYMDWPGMDELTETERKYWVPKQLLSVVRQLDKPRMLSELYGCTGWQFNFRSHKTVGDWQALFGVNFRCQHLSWYTMEGQAKRDYPASILHQSPWYRYYGKVEDYFNRFNVYNTKGKAACDVLLLNPIESMFCQMHIGWHNWDKQCIDSPEMAEIERKYREMFFMLTENHIDFDWGEEAIMSRHHSVGLDSAGKAVLQVGSMAYHVVIVGNMTTIRQSTVDMLRAFMALGGKVILMGEVPAYIDAVAYEGNFALLEGALQIDYDERALVDAVHAASSERILITERGGTARDVFVQAKHAFDGGDAFVILNTDLERGKEELQIKYRCHNLKHLERWDFETGERYNADLEARYENGNLIIQTSLSPSECRCYVLREEKDASLKPLPCYESMMTADFNGDFIYRLHEPNVCVLDFAAWRFENGDWRHEKQEILKIDMAIRRELKIPERSEAALQPWYVLQKGMNQSFGGVEIKYTFDIEELPTSPVTLVGERPEYNDYYVNGVKLRCPDLKDFWIDIAFKKLPIPAGVLRKGENEVLFKTDYKVLTNLEALYLIGDFGVRAEMKNAVLTASLPAKLACKSYAEQNLPFYSGNVTFQLSAADYQKKIALKAGERVFLTAEFYGAAAVIAAEGCKEQILAWEPYEADVTEAVKSGKDISVTVLGTRKNTFGPLHTVPCVVYRCGHGSFVTSGEEWTDAYHLLPDGLRSIQLTVKREENL